MQGNISEIQNGLDQGSAKIEDLLKKDEKLKESRRNSESQKEEKSPNQDSIQNSFTNREQLIK